MITLYGLIFPNDKIYIGQTNNFNNRMLQYKKNNLHSIGKFVSNAIQKYGWENIKKEILLECDAEYADFFERTFIKGYNSTNPKNGYNISEGGIASMRNRKHSKETLIKMGISQIGNTNGTGNLGKKRGPQSNEHKEKRIYSRKNNGNAWHSVKTIEKIKLSNLGISKNFGSSINSGEKNPMYGKKHSKETLKKISDALSGKNNPMYGKHHSEETKEKIKLSKLGKKRLDVSARNKNNRNKTR